MTIEARFLHAGNTDNALPTHYTYPGAGKVEGAQVLRISEAIAIALRGDHKTDDWYCAADYPTLALLKVSGRSGDTIGIGYAAILESDLEEMRVVDVSSATGFAWTMTEIAMDLEAQGLEIPMDGEQYDLEAMFDEYEDKVIELLWDAAEVVEPVFVDTLNQ
jgi:hypothetical protein